MKRRNPKQRAVLRPSAARRSPPDDGPSGAPAQQNGSNARSERRPKKPRKDAGKKRKRTYERWGLHVAKREAKEGAHLRSAHRPALERWRGEMVEHLGGPENVTAAQRTILDECQRQLYVCRVVDEFLLATGRVLNRKQSRLYAYVEQREKIGAALVKNLSLLGLERVARPELTLSEHLARRHQIDEDEDDEIDPPQ